jgi:hypothetical protein
VDSAIAPYKYSSRSEPHAFEPTISETSAPPSHAAFSEYRIFPVCDGELIPDFPSRECCTDQEKRLMAVPALTGQRILHFHADV